MQLPADGAIRPEFYDKFSISVITGITLKHLCQCCTIYLEPKPPKTIYYSTLEVFSFTPFGRLYLYRELQKCFEVSINKYILIQHLL